MKIVKYNPSFLTDDELIASFCVRSHEFASIIEMLRECNRNSNPHRLVIGPRGCGKTSLLLRVAAEVRREPVLSSSFFPIVFAEESYEVATAGEFWLAALSRLADQARCPEGEDNLHLTVEELRNTPDDRMLGKRCLGSLLDFSDQQDKRLILIVENLNMMFRDMSDRDAGWQLRKTLQTEPRIILLASATARFDEIDKPDRAFYDLFVSQTLHPLCIEECAILWGHVAGQHHPPEAMRGLQILTGGSPRLLSIIARFGAELSFRDLMADLMELIDDLTEYFKSHIETLAPQERRVYVALADLWEPASAREVATQARLDTSQCSAQLRRLVGRGVVEVVGGGSRKKLYYLAERLYNIYYLLRRARTSTPVIEALIRFMDAYYSPIQLKDLVFRMIREADGLEPKIRPFHWAALARLVDLPRLASYRKELLSTVPEEFLRSFGLGFASEDVADVTPTESKSTDLRPTAPFPQHVTQRERQPSVQVPIKQDPIKAAEGRTRSMDAIIRSTLKRMEIDNSLSGRVKAAKEIINGGVSFLQEGQFEETMVACEEVVRRFGDSDTPQLAEQVAKAILLKGITFGKSERYGEELASHDEIVRRFGNSTTPAVLHLVAWALVTKIRTLANLNRFDEAVVVCDDVVRRFNKSEVPEIHEQVAFALVGKGISFHALGQPDKELATYDEIVRRFSGSTIPRVREQVAFALVNKGTIFSVLGQPVKELASYDEVIRQFGDSDLPKIIEQVAKAIFFRGLALLNLKQPKETIAACNEIEQRFGDTDAPAVLGVIAQAMTVKGNVLDELKQPKKALVVYDEIIQRFGGSKMPDLLEITAQALFKKGGVLSELGNFEETISVCDEIVRLFGDNDTPGILVLVAHSLANKGSMLGELNRLEEIPAVSDEVIRQFGSSDVPEIFSAVAHAYGNKVRSLVELDRSEQAIAVCSEVAHRFGGNIDSPEICSQAAHLLLDIGRRFDESNRFEEAATVCDEIAQQFGAISEPDILKVVAQALTNKGSVLLKSNRLEEAIAACDEVVRRFGGSNEPVALEAVARVLVNKGDALMDLSRPEEAIAACDEVVRRFDGNNKPVMLKAVAQALVNKGAALVELSHSEEAIAVCNEIAQRFGDRNAHQFHTQIARMLICKGLALSDLQQEKQAKAVWQELVQRFGTSDNPVFRHPVAVALLRLADSARIQGHLDEVISTVDLLFDRYSEQIYSCYQCEGYLIRSRAHLTSNDLPQAEQDIKTALTLLPNCEFLLSEAIYALIDFTVSQGATYTNDIIQSSPSVKLLTPLTVALEKEMGREPKVALELEEVAEDIRKDIEKVRRAGNQQ